MVIETVCRIVGVSFGLLCLLQVTLNITLRLLCELLSNSFSSNKQTDIHKQYYKVCLSDIEFNNLTNDGQECQMGYGSLVEERDLLLTKYAKLSEEKELLLINYTTLAEERDRLHKELDDLVGWKSFQSSLYFFSIEDRNWTMSRKDCRQRGADLVIINSKEEQEFISARVRDTWIGLTDSDIEGEWRWVDGTLPITKFWMENEPNNAVMGEDCELGAGVWSRADETGLSTPPLLLSRTV
ncbi:CD209 antigen-like protein D [Alosa alosa]|uniref:CD209 antigen-like protein D n=1 Tax=Alosa alosa TaxID=278164 RepID=UPI00201527C4|nr:CD209 antigen-like protein D [Alosa alosa]